MIWTEVTSLRSGERERSIASCTTIEPALLIICCPRSFAKPPQPVQIVCECVAILRGQKDPDWKVVKGIMAETNFLHSLQTLAVDDITMGQVQLDSIPLSLCINISCSRCVQ